MYLNVFAVYSFLHPPLLLTSSFSFFEDGCVLILSGSEGRSHFEAVVRKFVSIHKSHAKY